MSTRKHSPATFGQSMIDSGHTLIRTEAEVTVNSIYAVKCPGLAAMIDFLRLVLALAADLLRSRARLVAETLCFDSS